MQLACSLDVYQNCEVRRLRLCYAVCLDKSNYSTRLRYLRQLTRMDTGGTKDSMSREDDGIFVALTHDHLDIVEIVNRVKSPKAGAVVTFAGKANSASRGQLMIRMIHYYTKLIEKASLEILLTRSL